MRALCSCAIALGVFLLLGGAHVYAKTWHMPDDFPNLHAAFAKMSGGDTLVIRAGTYTGASNVINNDHKPPDGTAQRYTVVKAADGADVFFDGEFARCMFGPTALHYVRLEGIKWGQYKTGGVVEISHSSFVKMAACAAFDMASCCSGTISVTDSSYVLLEDCWVWGNARYSFLVYQSDHVVVRRCVARMDRSTGVREPIGIFRNYTSDYVEWQNCIAIDSDRRAEYFTEPKGPLYGAFYHSGSSNIYWRGVIALNNHMPAGWVGGGCQNKEFHNCVFWDNWSGICTQGTAVLDHCTVNSNSTATDEDGIRMGGGVGLWWGQEYDNSVTNSIIYACPWWGLRPSGPGSFPSNHNILYGNKTNYINVTPGTNDLNDTVDPVDGDPGNGKPALKYIIRIERGSDASGAAADGGDIGANILKRCGVSGTLWGEPGYNTLTDEDLWPFPNEEKMRRDMQAYSYDDGRLSGKRGFCTDGRTLTGYIWEYLGNRIPPEIYRRRTSP